MKYVFSHNKQFCAKLEKAVQSPGFCIALCAITIVSMGYRTKYENHPFSQAVYSAHIYYIVHCCTGSYDLTHILTSQRQRNAKATKRDEQQPKTIKKRQFQRVTGFIFVTTHIEYTRWCCLLFLFELLGFINSRSAIWQDYYEKRCYTSELTSSS